MAVTREKRDRQRGRLRNRPSGFNILVGDLQRDVMGRHEVKQDKGD
jgi:hypothetical protein